jgi:NADH-quinone oxidoreductase subunit N
MRGLAWRGGAFPAVAMAVFLFSLAGLPPLAGFVGKVYLFAAVIDQQMWLLAAAAALNTVLAMFYYARVVREMFLLAPAEGAPPMAMDAEAGLLIGLLLAGTLVFGIYWTPVASFTERSMRLFAG